MAETLNIVYKSQSDNTIFIARYDGTTWHGNNQILVQNAVLNPIESNYGPSAINYTGGVFVIYKGAHSNDVYQSTFTDSIVGWRGNTPIVTKDPSATDPIFVSTVKSNYNPGLAVFGALLFMVYKPDYSNDLCASYRDSGGDWHWNAQIQQMAGGAAKTPGGIAPKSNYDPSVGTLVINKKNTLILVYKGESSNTLYTTQYDGATWTGDKKISEQAPFNIAPESNYTPASVVYKNRLYIIYKGAHSNTLYYASYDGATWSGNTPIDIEGVPAPKSDQTPGAVVYNGLLYICYKSQSSNDLFTAWYDGDDWYGNKPISSQPGGISPKSNYGPGMYVDGSIQTKSGGPPAAVSVPTQAQLKS